MCIRDRFLVSDAGTLKRIDYSLIKGGGITEIDTWRVTADFSEEDMLQLIGKEMILMVMY